MHALRYQRGSKLTFQLDTCPAYDAHFIFAHPDFVGVNKLQYSLMYTYTFINQHTQTKK